MSKKFEVVKYYYENNNWCIDQVHQAVERGWITAAEYLIITGEVYA